MKKYLFFMIIIFIILASCSKKENPVSDYNYIPYDEIPDNYSLDDAKKDNCVVHENSNITSGQEI